MRFADGNFTQDEGKFDLASIPLKSWQDFENELWEQVRSASVAFETWPHLILATAGFERVDRRDDCCFKTRRHRCAVWSRRSALRIQQRARRVASSQSLRPTIAIRGQRQCTRSTAARLALRYTTRVHHLGILWRCWRDEIREQPRAAGDGPTDFDSFHGISSRIEPVAEGRTSERRADSDGRASE